MTAFLVMVLAGFSKHNIIGMPMAAFLWLSMYRPKQMVRCVGWSLVLVLLGLSVCLGLYGHAFLDNLLAPRFRDWRHVLGAVGHLQWVAPALICWCFVGFSCRAESSVRFCNLFILVALASFFLQKLGDGVSYNAQFDLVIAVSLSVGLAYEYAPRLVNNKSYSPEVLRFVLLATLCIRLCISSRMEPYQLWIDPSFRQEIAIREMEMAKTIAIIKKMPGNVSGSTYACYRAGKPFVLDLFNVNQRIKAGQMTQEAYQQLLKDKAITFQD